MRRADFIGRSIMGALSFLKDSVFSEEYAQKTGLGQALDPRAKLLAVVLLLLAVLFSKNISFLAGMYLACLLLALLSSVRLGFFLKRTWVFVPLFSLFVALPALFDIVTPGEPIAVFKVLSFSLTITRQGAASATLFFLRVLTSVSLCVLLVLTTRHYALLRVLRIFRVPQVFVMTLGMCYRYIYLFIEMIQNTYMAVKSRVGYVSSVNKGHRVVAWNIASLWQRSYHMHIDVYNAMLSRGYSGEPKVMDEPRLRPGDLLCLITAALILGLSLWQNRYLS